jgi:hypothetical protein
MATLAGVLFGALGPFGSYLNGGFAIRVAYWIASMWLGFGIYGAAIFAARRIAPAGTAGAWPVFIVLVLVASLPEGLATHFAAIRLWPYLPNLGVTWTGWYLQTALIGLIISVVGTAVLERPRDRGGDGIAEPVPKSAQSGSLACPVGEVLALQMEDHYVRIHTATGSQLVLMPLGRAIEVVGAVEGLRTHRSWWVARRAVMEINGTPRSMTLRLSNGIVAPVARASVTALRSAGWLESPAETRPS